MAERAPSTWDAQARQTIQETARRELDRIKEDILKREWISVPGTVTLTPEDARRLRAYTTLAGK